MNMPLLALFRIPYKLEEIDKLWTFISGRVRDVVVRHSNLKWKNLFHDRMKTWSMLEWNYFKKLVQRTIDYRIPVEHRKQCERTKSFSFKPLQIASEEQFDDSFCILSLPPSDAKTFAEVLHASYATVVEKTKPKVKPIVVPVVVKSAMSDEKIEEIRQKQVETAAVFKAALEEADAAFGTCDSNIIQAALDKAKAAWEVSNKAHCDFLALY